MVKSMRWAGHAVRTRQMRNSYKIVVGNMKRETTLKT